MEFVIEILKTVVLGIIQGITEWLPISSTGHMILADAFLNLNQPKEFMDMFYVVIQLGSILAVVVLYFQKLNPFSPSKSRAERLSTFQLWFKVLVAVLPIGVIGLLVDDWVTEHFYTPTVVAAALIIYGVLFILLEKRNKQVKPRIRSFEQLSYRTAACIGFLQLLAIIPGTSRSGSTILGAMLLSCSRFVATEFSFFMAIPVMFGASLLKILHYGLAFSAMELFFMAAAMVIAFVVSMYSIQFLLGYVKKHDFKFFGYYRIVLGVIVLIYFGLTAILTK